MTREEAIARLEANRGAFVFKETNEALDMAIEALSQPIVAKHFDIESGHIYCSPQDAENVKVVVRCKDCRHRCKEPIYSKADAHWVIYQIGDCPIICKTVSDDDYCSWGERREP